MNNKKEEKINEDLKRLEDEAYYELMQIIAEAMYTQDIKLLNDRIASWKYKYKKLLDRPSSDSKSDFKRKIEYLLNQYYSEVTQYILNQLKLNEEKKINNQAKAMRELYAIIRDTNDLDLLNKKVDSWKEKYPVSGFLNMYKKRIELYTRDKNLKENAFNQEEAFSDLLEITKIHGTYDELKEELALWEKKYSINDKYTIDDFIKHQSEVNRFVSDEFLTSIAREDYSKNDDNQIPSEGTESKMYSDLSKQATAYTALLAISRSPNSVDKMFKWVYKNRNIKFNDKYKEMILSATHMDYSPSYLNKLKTPSLDILKSSLSFEEYKNIGEIKRYAIISYFNLLLPPDRAISNDFFDKNVRLVYEKSEKAKQSQNKNDTATSIDDLTKSGIEIQLTQTETDKDVVTTESIPEENIYVENEDDTIDTESSSQESTLEIRNTDSIDVSDNEIKPSDEDMDIIAIESSDQTPVEPSSDLELVDENSSDELTLEENYSEDDKDTSENIISDTLPEDMDIESETIDSEIKEIQEDISSNSSELELSINKSKNDNIITETEIENENDQDLLHSKEQVLDLPVLNEDNNELSDENYSNSLDEKVDENKVQENTSEDYSHATIVAFSPKFFEAIDYLNNQAIAVNIIDKSTNKFIKQENERSIENDEYDSQIKNKNNPE